MIKVKAITTGYFGDSIKPVGAEFTIESRKQLGKWMKVVEDLTPQPKTEPVTKDETNQAPTPEKEPDSQPDVAAKAVKKPAAKK